MQYFFKTTHGVEVLEIQVANFSLIQLIIDFAEVHVGPLSSLFLRLTSLELFPLQITWSVI